MASPDNNAYLWEIAQPVLIYGPGAVSTNGVSLINMANYERCSFLITVSNNTTGATVLALGLSQATNSNGAGLKTLAFSTYAAYTNPGSFATTTTNRQALGLPTITTATSNTFNTAGTASKNSTSST